VQAALAGQADLIVTEDKDLLDGTFEGVRIVPPWDFLSLL
jgi:predicted nucleic acid-binding protein